MKLRYLTMMCLLTAISVAYAGGINNKDVYYDAVPVAVDTAAQFARLDGKVAAMDEQRGVPTFIWADRITPKVAPYHSAEPAARWYLSRFARAYRLGKAALATAYVSEIHDTGRGGIIVSFRQNVNGVEVVRNELHVLMKRDFSLMAITGNLHEAAGQQSYKFRLPAEDAVARALTDVAGAVAGAAAARVSRADVEDSGSRSEGGYGYYNLTSGAGLARAGLRMTEPARVRRVLYPMPDRLVPGYYVELFTGKTGTVDATLSAYVLAADSGQVMQRRNMTQADVFSYRVWADNVGFKTPADGPQENYTPHPSNDPYDGYSPAYVSPAFVSIEGFNTNPMGMIDPWLPAGATESVGNNVDAYADIAAPDGYTNGQDLRAVLTGANRFDYTYDPLQAPGVSDNQRRAAVTQLFFVNNWLHDYFYDSGFDEAAGNAQQNNMGRGGLGNDRLRAEGQDYSGMNNANMSTPADGSAPRMQMYTWTGPSQSSLVAAGTTYGTGTAAFGPTMFNIPGNMAFASDGAGADVNDGCEAIMNNVSGAIALIHRGNCNFTVKAANAQAAGAVGVIISNNAPLGPPPGMAGTDPTITVGVLSVTYEAGQALEAAIAGMTVPATMFRGNNEVNRDGTIDNNIVAHEWGHYIHNRLVDCGSQMCGGEGEGWGDFFALHTSVREGDNYNGAFGMAGYSTASTYFGIRRVPYSSNPMYNALSFRHIQNGEPLPDTHPVAFGGDNAEVHNAGEIWATFMHEGYTSLLGQTVGPMPTATFEEVRRRMADYVVGGMKLAPIDATYNEQLDSILAAAAAQNAGDHALLLQAFAARGAGSCSSSPARYSTDLIGVVEDFQVRGALEILSVAMDDSVVTCDSDGYLDAGENGMLVITLGNTGDAELINTSVVANSSNPNVSFPNGASANVASILPNSTAVVNIEIAGAASMLDPESVTMDVTAMNMAACDTTVTYSESYPVHFDPAPSTLDTVEVPLSTWTTGGTVADNWHRAVDRDAAGNHVWYGPDLGAPTDTYVTTAAIDVAAAGNFVLAFDHRYLFEYDATTFWDGGVIEISSDNGATWQDISMYGNPGYDGTITNISGNPLADRQAFSGPSPMWPNFQTVTLDLGTGLAGQTVRLRFRIGTDALVGDFGWEVDNIAVVNSVNSPFIDIGPDAGGCIAAPTANAGPDQTVNIGDTVTLDGTASMDPDGGQLVYMWLQTAGPAVTLNNADMDMAVFTAPTVAVDTVLTFELTVDNGNRTATDTVDVTVLADVAMPDAGVPDAGLPDAGAEPDADIGNPDADIGDPDAGTINPPDDGGGCCQTNARPSMGNLALSVLVMFGIAVITRRRRREYADSAD